VIAAFAVAPEARATLRIDPTPSWNTPGDLNFFDVALGDVDDDGDLDLAAYADDTVRLYRNTGGAFETTPAWTSTDATTFSGQVAWADAGGDGDLDLFSTLGLYVNTGGVLARTATFAPLANADAFAVGDVDGDGVVDVVVGDYRQIDLYLNAGGTLDETSDWNTTEDNLPESLALADVDRDGSAELAVGNTARPVRLYDNVAGTLETTASWSSSEGDTVNHVRFGDVDGDQYPELLALTDNLLSEVPNRMYDNAAGQLSASATWSSARPTDGMDAAFADLDADGDLDLVIASSPMISFATFDYVNGTELVYLNEAGTIDPVHDWESEAQDVTYGLDVGRVDGDAFPDLVTANVADLLGTYQGRVLVYRNLGPNHAPSVAGLTAAPQAPREGDIVTITANASDADGDALTYAFTFSAGTAMSQTDNVLRWRAPSQAGTYTIVVNVTDGQGGLDSETLTLAVAAAPSETPFFSAGNPLLWLIIVVVIVAAAGGAAFAMRRRKVPTKGPAEVVSGGAPATGAALPLTAADDRAAALRNAYRNGMLPRELYGENLSRVLAVPPSTQRDALLRAFADGRIDEDMLERNLWKLRGPAT